MKIQRTKPVSGQLGFLSAEVSKPLLVGAWRLELHDEVRAEAIRGGLAAFRTRIGQLDRHHLLSLTGLYALIGAAGALQRQGAYPEVAEFECLQALALGTEQGPDIAPLPADEVLPFWRELQAQFYVATRQRREPTSAVDAMARSHTMFYRNPYGDEFFDRMMLAITGEYDARFDRSGRVARTGEAMVALRREILSRFSTHIAIGRKALTASRAAAVRILREYRPALSDAEYATVYGALDTGTMRRAAYNAVEDRALQSMFRLEAEWIAARQHEGLPMAELLARLSASRLGQADPVDLVVENPVWSAPVVDFGDGAYALYSPFTLMSFPFRALLVLLSHDPQAKPRLEKVRGWFAEQEGRRLLTAALPSAQVVLGGYWWRTPTERVEADLLVLVANRLLIFEAKGALIPDRVRLGARDATVRFLKDVWAKAGLQAADLSDHLSRSDAPVVIEDAKGETVMTIDPGVVRSVSRFAISVEQVGPLMNAPAMLRDAGVVGSTASAAPCIILSELEEVLRHAEGELQKLHYMLGRAAIGQRYQILGDELDVYTTYLQFGFTALPASDNDLILLGASYTLHEYLDRAGRVVLPSDSALRCSPYFERVLDHARRRASPTHLDLGLLLMDMPLAQQREFERRMHEAFAKRPRDEDWPVLTTATESPGGTKALAIVLIDLAAATEHPRDVGMNLAASLADRFGAQEAVSIVRLWKDVDAYAAVYFGGQTLRGAARRSREGDGAAATASSN